MSRWLCCLLLVAGCSPRSASPNTDDLTRVVQSFSDHIQECSNLVRESRQDELNHYHDLTELVQQDRWYQARMERRLDALLSPRQLEAVQAWEHAHDPKAGLDPAVAHYQFLQEEPPPPAPDPLCHTEDGYHWCEAPSALPKGPHAP